MAKPKERSELEFLRSQLRALKSENKHLKKQLGKSEKRLVCLENTVDENQETAMQEEEIGETYIVKSEVCPKCQKSSLQRTDIGVRTLVKCLDCNFRKSEKK